MKRLERREEANKRSRTETWRGQSSSPAEVPSSAASSSRPSRAFSPMILRAETVGGDSLAAHHPAVLGLGATTGVEGVVDALRDGDGVGDDEVEPGRWRGSRRPLQACNPLLPALDA